jgi:hypothetical protein
MADERLDVAAGFALRLPDGWEGGGRTMFRFFVT